MKFYIYCLIDPRDYKVRYVGRTTGRMDHRLAAHVGQAERGKASPLYDWIRSLLPGRPWLACLETCDALVKKHGGGWREASEQIEVKWIKRFRRECLNDLSAEECKRDWINLVNVPTPKVSPLDKRRK